MAWLASDNIEEMIVVGTESFLDSLIANQFLSRIFTTCELYTIMVKEKV